MICQDLSISTIPKNCTYFPGEQMHLGDAANNSVHTCKNCKVSQHATSCCVIQTLTKWPLDPEFLTWKAFSEAQCMAESPHGASKQTAHQHCGLRDAKILKTNYVCATCVSERTKHVHHNPSSTLKQYEILETWEIAFAQWLTRKGDMEIIQDELLVQNFSFGSTAWHALNKKEK